MIFSEDWAVAKNCHFADDLISFSSSKNDFKNLFSSFTFFNIDFNLDRYDNIHLKSMLLNNSSSKKYGRGSPQ